MTIDDVANGIFQEHKTLARERDEARAKLDKMQGKLRKARGDIHEARAELRAAVQQVDAYQQSVESMLVRLNEARAIADEQAERMKFCSRCKPVPRPWAKDER
jgi:predicted  nucleic acid-binding Zn-ribbon protein